MSYSALDQQDAEELLSALEDCGLSMWFAPRDIQKGSSYADQIVEAIKACSALVVLMTPAASISKDVLTEVQQAHRRRPDVPIYPVRLSDFVPEGGISYFLSLVQWTDWFGAHKDGALEVLAVELGGTPSGSRPADGIERESGTDLDSHETVHESALGLYNKGCELFHGASSNSDYEKAAEYFHRSADRGYAPAQTYLGLMYFDGSGVDADPDIAFHWWQRAAEKGDAYGQQYLGVAYENGIGVQPSREAAIYWYKLAAAQGAKMAQKWLAAEGLA